MLPSDPFADMHMKSDVMPGHKIAHELYFFATADIGYLFNKVSHFAFEIEYNKGKNVKAVTESYH
jgi:hypothetical protein